MFTAMAKFKCLLYIQSSPVSNANRVSDPEASVLLPISFYVCRRESLFIGWRGLSSQREGALISVIFLFSGLIICVCVSRKGGLPARNPPSRIPGVCHALGVVAVGFHAIKLFHKLAVNPTICVCVRARARSCLSRETLRVEADARAAGS